MAEWQRWWVATAWWQRWQFIVSGVGGCSSGSVEAMVAVWQQQRQRQRQLGCGGEWQAAVAQQRWCQWTMYANLLRYGASLGGPKTLKTLHFKSFFDVRKLRQAT